MWAVSAPNLKRNTRMLCFSVRSSSQQPFTDVSLAGSFQPQAAIQLLAYLCDLEKSASTEALGTIHIGAWHFYNHLCRYHRASLNTFETVLNWQTLNLAH